MASTLVALLGGERTLGRKADTKWIELLRAGLPYAALESVMNTLGLTREEVSDLLAIPLRTLARRKLAHRLRAAESDRLYRIATVAADVADLFESKAGAVNWLRRPNRALGGVAPLTLLDTEAGTREVETIVGRIKYGGFS
jgi:putative toxin-antitoxin system antitoxin component (TIGR02293 family)